MEQLTLHNVTKIIQHNAVLKGINLELYPGHVYGFVGRNGSGKTMLFRAIAGLISLTEGTVTLDGKVLHKDMSVLPNVGLVIENIGLYPEFTGYQNLKILANLNKKIDKKQIRKTIERLGLNPDDKRTFRKYSLGMKQRIVLAQALMEEPDILLLDEPTNGLDESGVDLLRNIVREEKKRGALILIASHNKEDIDLLCDTKLYIKEGQLVEGQA
jgi:ABC-2 type transport system ATP-binding protein